MNYRVKHTTIYDYSKFVSLCHNCAHLRPRSYLGQVCTSWDLKINPLPTVLNDQIDFFGNHVTFFSIQESLQHLDVTSVSRVQVTNLQPIEGDVSPPWEQVRALLRQERSTANLDAYQFTFDSTYVKRDSDLAAYAAESFSPGRPFFEASIDLMRRIHTDFKYDPTATTITTPLRAVFTGRRGICQDFAHLQIGCLRSLGLAARYVSGYLLTRPPPGQRRLLGADASHAWVSSYCHNFGWIDLDPTNNVVPAGEHILLGWGRDYEDVSPIKGIVLGGGKHSVRVGVDVVPEEEQLEQSD